MKLLIKKEAKKLLPNIIITFLTSSAALLNNFFFVGPNLKWPVGLTVRSLGTVNKTSQASKDN